MNQYHRQADNRQQRKESLIGRKEELIKTTATDKREKEQRHSHQAQGLGLLNHLSPLLNNSSRLTKSLKSYQEPVFHLGAIIRTLGNIMPSFVNRALITQLKL